MGKTTTAHWAAGNNNIVFILLFCIHADLVLMDFTIGKENVSTFDLIDLNKNKCLNKDKIHPMF